MSHNRTKIWKEKYDNLSLSELTPFVVSDTIGLSRSEKRFVEDLARKKYKQENKNEIVDI